MILHPIIGALLATTSKTPGSFFGMPEQASSVARDVDRIYDFITWISLFFFVLIVGLMVYFVIKYRRRAHVAETGSTTHNTVLEVTWTIIPLALVIVIFYLGLRGYIHLATPPENAYTVDVTAQRWSWTFNYSNGATDTNVLHVPVGRPVRLNMRSEDVLHSLFIPAFRVKQDVVPGRRTELWFEALREGEFELYCAEYCGTKHSQMLATVKVYSELEFDAVIDDLAAWIDRVSEEQLHLAGALIFNQCASCHTVDGSSSIGPSFKETHDLFAAGGTRELADGTTVAVDEDYIRNSILEPLTRIAKDSASGAPYPASMPPGIGNQLGPRKVEAMVRLITQLDEVAPDGNLIEVSREAIAPKPPEGQ
ncbi:MAG: cytochrome c oxidase subunit II [Planctomycetota bacterium]